MSDRLERPRRRRSDADGWVQLPPDSSVLQALGGGHTFESALADIIDNSIDARASRILIRFIVDDAALIAVQIKDDGTGMTRDELVSALRLGNRRTYDEEALGYYGIGLKAASMRHAERLTVFSAAASASGELEISALELDSTARGGSSEIGARVLNADRAHLGYTYGYEGGAASSGTIVEWNGLRATSSAASVELRQAWLDRLIESTRSVLGLVFHRFIEDGDLRIELDCFEPRFELAGVPRRVEPVDPFKYQLSGAPGYPLTVVGETGDGIPVRARCHVLPPKGVDRGLVGKREDWQGVYVYRRRRLLTFDAGWQGLALEKSDLRLARVEIELTDELERYMAPAPEKNGVVFHPEYLAALEEARDPSTGTGFRDFLSCARNAWKEATKRTTDKPLVELSAGLPEPLLAQIGESFGWRNGQLPAAIVWEEIATDDLFKIDLERRVLILNSRHASSFGGAGSPAAHAFATLLYIHVEHYLTRSSHLRGTTQDHLEQIDTALLTALELEGETGPESAPLESPRPTAPIPRSVRTSTAERQPALFQDGFGAMAEAAAQVEPYSWTAHAAVASTEEPESGLANDQLDEDLVATAPTRRSTPPPRAASDEGSAAVHDSGPAVRDPLTRLDLLAFEAYCAGMGVAEVAGTLEISEGATVRSLALAVFGGVAVDHDATLASHHGLPYTPEEREKIIRSYRDGHSVAEVARRHGRTPFSIAWHLLDSPKRPVVIDKRMRKNVRRRVVGA